MRHLWYKLQHSNPGWLLFSSP